ncbi:M949_RS01915 family surface polysaccharide biosynthesis protein [Hymenobacter sediminicola]|uniref:Uncharacterized protein n=1 Tax=Hymenobacter sediminicola TaxID=2761579 RepID=A0A7G7W6F3_9BACT|nr:hypothetical protein [Hymenobacter sediminicola]QNH61946.1 hypothetical protein H4317_17650 [Hymenobacter sediminicola]
MHNYFLGLLLLLAVACSDKKGEPTTHSAETPVAAAAPDSAVNSAAPIVAEKVLLAHLPAQLRLPGQLLEAWRWTDSQGENLLVVFRTVTKSRQQLAAAPPDSSDVQDIEDFERSAQLTARQYVLAGGTYKELWRLQDAVQDCPFDMWLGPLPGATSITDLDKDGQTETTLLYKLTCRSDVSPSGLKLIMREGAAKYALRGQMVVAYDSVPVSERTPANPCCLDTISQRQLNAPDGYKLFAGCYKSEKEFRKAPVAFLLFARQQWRKWSVQDEFDQF